MREITSHQIAKNDLNLMMRIQVCDDAGSGGANHHYQLTTYGDDTGFPAVEIRFQNGPVKEVGLNGISNEALLAVIIDRLEGFQRGNFSCRENAIALTKLQEAQHWLNHRTLERLARGVEGTNQK